jgi:hypothetical protein
MLLGRGSALGKTFLFPVTKTSSSSRSSSFFLTNHLGVAKGEKECLLRGKKIGEGLGLKLFLSSFST